MTNYKLFLLLILFSGMGCAQEKEPEIIQLQSDPAKSGMTWEAEERLLTGPDGELQMASNVSAPSMQVFRPEKGKANGTALVIAPGGGFHMLSMANEGNLVAEWAAARGITAFVLKYRLVPTGEDPVGEFREKVSKGRDQMDEEIAPYIELAKADGLAAIAHVRSNSETYGIDAGKIGIIGFSAGGTVAAAAALEYEDKANRPDFAAPIYGALQVLELGKLPEEPMPLFMVVASDDVFGFQQQSVELYQTWNQGGQPAELHIYEKGGHGFGMRKQGLPSDAWTEAFAAWLGSYSLLTP